MPENNFKLIFDVVESGYRNWWFPAFGLIFVAIGAGIIIYRHFRSKTQPSVFYRLFPYIFTGFGLVWTLSVFVSTYSDYRNLRNAVLNGQCQIVEGAVTNFFPYIPHQQPEQFFVNGHRFEYSDGVITAGFNDSDGPIHDGLYVRICDIHGDIARLEIAE